MTTRQHLVPGAIALGEQTIDKPGWHTITSTEARGPQSGFIRIYWRIRRRPTTVGAIPRVKIGWSVFLENSGQLSDFGLVADAWFGVVIVNATSASIQTGYVKGEKQGDEYEIEATMFDGGSVSSGPQFVAYTQPVSLTNPIGPSPADSEKDVPVPMYVTSMRWFDKAGSDVELVGKDPAGTEIELCRTGIPAAGALFTPPQFPLEPEIAGGTIHVKNLTAADIANGRLTFYYSGDQSC